MEEKTGMAVYHRGGMSAGDWQEVVQQTVAKNIKMSDGEWRLFQYVCKNSGLDPLLRQIYVQKYHNNQSNKDDLVFITGIDGARSIAERTGRFGGVKDYLFDDGLTVYQMLDRYKDKDKRSELEQAEELNAEKKSPKIIPRTATATVIKVVHGIAVETTATVRWGEFYPTDPKKRFMWNKFPFHQLGTRAEFHALKRAFPIKMSGLFMDVEEPDSEDGEDTVLLVNETHELMGTLGYSKAASLDWMLKRTGKRSVEECTAIELRYVISELEKEIPKGGKGGQGDGVPNGPDIVQ
jgi:phage recombination protein Bet